MRFQIQIKKCQQLAHLASNIIRIFLLPLSSSAQSTRHTRLDAKHRCHRRRRRRRRRRRCRRCRRRYQRQLSSRRIYFPGILERFEIVKTRTRLRPGPSSSTDAILGSSVREQIILLN